MIVRLGKNEHIGITALQRRGWTLQELILPSRIVHFTGHELVWECNTHNFCECGHIHDTDLRMERMEKTAMIQQSMGSESLLYGGWMALVAAYSARKLSDQSDKLVAIAGLAGMVRMTAPDTTGSTYVAGMFTSSFPGHLLWSTEERDNSPMRACPLPAPTWSWAAVDGPITYNHIIYYQEDDKMVLANSKVLSTSGTEQGDELILRGPALPVHLMTWENNNKGRYRTTTGARTDSGWILSVTCDVDQKVDFLPAHDGCNCEHCWEFYNCWGDLSEEHPLRYKACKQGRWTPSEESYIVLVGSYGRRIYGGSRFFLLLRRSKSTQGTWERLGLGQLRDSLLKPFWSRGIEKVWGSLQREAEVKEFKVV